MGGYWLIKALLVAGFAVLIWVLVKPARSARYLALRRLGIVVVLGASIVGVLFPSWLNSFASLLGVKHGINLLVYALVVAVFALLANSYRRSVTEEMRITQLARTLALASVRYPTNQHDPSHHLSEHASSRSTFTRQNDESSNPGDPAIS